MPVIDSQVPPEPSGQYSLAGVQLTSLCWVCGGKMEPALDMCATCRVQMEEGGGRDWLSKKLGLKETSMEDGRGAGAGRIRGATLPRGPITRPRTNHPQYVVIVIIIIAIARIINSKQY